MGLLDKLDDAWESAKDAASDVGEAVWEGTKQVGSGVAGLGHDLFVEPYQEAGTGVRWYDALGHGLSSAVGDVGQIVGGAFEVGTSPLRALNINAPELLAKPYGYVDRNLATAELWAKMQGGSGGSWDEAAEIRRKNNLTLGGSLALQLMNGDIRDQQQVQNYQQGRLYKSTAGILDVTVPFLIDPLVVAGKGAQMARMKFVVRPIKATDSMTEIVASRHVADFKQSIRGLSASEILAKYQHKNMDATTAQILAFADREGSLDTALLSMMGHTGAAQALATQGSVVVANIERLKGQLDYLRAGGVIDPPYQLTSAANPHGAYPPVSPQALADTIREHDFWVDQGKQIKRLDDRLGSMKNVPHTSAYTEMRSTALRSDWFQSSKTATPLRAVYQMNPRGIVNLDDANAHTKLLGMLQHSDLTPEMHDLYLNRFLDAPGPMEKAQIFEQAREHAITSILDRHHLSDTTKAQILADFKNGSGKADASLKTAEYDGKGRGTVRLDDADGPTVLKLPLLGTQNPNLLTVPDLLKLDKMVDRYKPTRLSALRRGEGDTFLGPELGRKMDMGEAELERFQRLWKASTLLRVAYPLRVVGEEQLRLMAMYGTLSQFKQAGQGLMNKAQDFKRVQERVIAERERFAAEHGRAPDFDEVDKIRERVKDDYYRTERIRGAREPEFFGVRTEPALGGEGKIFNHLIDTRSEHDRSFGRDDISNDAKINEFLAETAKMRGTGQFVGGIEYLDANGAVNPMWKRAWYTAVTRQIAPDAAARKILQGADHDQMMAWTRTPQGKAYLQKLHGYWQTNPEDWLDNLIGHVEDYLPTPALKEAALSGKLTMNLAAKEFDTYGSHPIVHGEALEAALPDPAMWRMVNKITEVGFKKLAQQPTHVLSRSPAFDHAYRREMSWMIERHLVQTGQKPEQFQLDTHRLQQFQRNARRVALGETRKLLFDLSTESDLSHSLRFVSPFFNAFEEVMRTWGRLAAQNPKVIPQLNNLWQAPDRAGLVVQDENGDERIILPFSFTLPGVGKIDGINLSKKGLNTILNMPGVGPVVTVPAVEITKNRPDLQSSEFMQFMFPYGVPADVSAAVLPKTIKNTLTALNHNYDDKRYLSLWTSIYNTETVNYNLGLRSTAPTRSEVDERAKKMAWMQVLTDFVSPTQTKFDTPYQSMIDSYKRLQAADPETADQKFYEQFGEDYFQLTAHINRLTAGVPASIEGWKEFNQHKDLIAQHPELGSIIVGDQAWSAPYNQAVQNWLGRTRLPGSGETLRRLRSPNEIVDDPQVRLGWIEFHKFMTSINAELDARGLDRLTDKGAQDLKQLKKDYINNHLKYLGDPEKKKVSAWYDTYTNWDMDASNKRAAALEDIASAPSLQFRTDISGLREYLGARRDFLAELAARDAAGGSGDIRAKANSDLADLWEGWTSSLVLRNPAFEGIYNRYLDNDHLSAR